MLPDAASVFDLDPDLHQYAIDYSGTERVVAETEEEALNYFFDLAEIPVDVQVSNVTEEL
jgi:hypothetical protein